MKILSVKMGGGISDIHKMNFQVDFSDPFF